MAGGKWWGDLENTHLLEMAASGMFFDAIAGRLNRSAEAVRLHYLELLRGMSPKARAAAKSARDASWAVPVRCGVAHASEIADRDARAKLSHASLTAAFFGDPLPGRSALDQRNQNPTPAPAKGETHASHY